MKRDRDIYKGPLLGVLIGFIAFLLCPGVDGENGRGPDGGSVAQRLVPGEKLHYKGYIFGFIPVGDVWMEVAEGNWEGRDVYRISARGYGSCPFYTLDISLTSYVDRATGLSLAYGDRQTGTEVRERALLFDRGKGMVAYRKRRGPYHTEKEMEAAPWYTRNETKVPEGTNDVLNSLYSARSIGTGVGDKGSFWFIEKDWPWRVDVEVIGERKMRLKGLGTFDVLRIDIRPDYSSRQDKAAEFRGLFGVGGTLQVYVEKETKIPLMVTGRVPVAYIFRPTVTAVLKEMELPGDN